MKILKCIAGFLLGMFILASQVQAQGAKMMTIGQIPPVVEDKLGLSTSQSDKIATLKEKYSVEIEVITDALKTKREELSVALAAVTLDRKKVDVIVDDISRLTVQEMDKRIDQAFEVHAILTPEQNQKLVQLMQEKRDMRTAKGKKTAGGDKGKGKGKKRGKKK